MGAPGLAAPAGATVLDASGTLLHPGLINAHTHAHGNLAKGMGDLWTLELLLTAGPWISGSRTHEERHLSAKIGAVEMVLKGCTAAYDLPLEWPAPTLAGLEAVGRGYAEVGMRAVVAPMIADRSFFEAIPGLIGVLPPELQKAVEALRLAPGETSIARMSPSPLPSRMLLPGLCATEAPWSPSRVMSSASSQTPWATVKSGPSAPRSSRCAVSVLP